MKLKTIFLIDHHWEGHHLTYLKIFAKTLLDQNHNVVVISPKNNEITDWLKKESTYKNFYTYQSPSLNTSNFRFEKLRPVIEYFKNWRDIKTIVNKARSDYGVSADLIFFNWFDDFAKPLPKWATFLINFYIPYKWGGLGFQLRRFYKNNSSAEKVLVSNLFRVKSCKVIATLDEGLADFIQDKKIQNKIVTFPDITYSDVADGKLVQDIKKAANGRKVISMLGALDHRKGFLTLLNVAERLKDNNEYFFVFAGKMYRTFLPDKQQEVDALLLKKLPNTYLYLDYIESDSEFNGMVRASDILFLVYDNFDFSSNLLTKAAIFNKPVVTSRDTLMGDRVVKYGTGEVIAQGNIEESIKAIEDISQGKKIYNIKNYQKYAKEHSIDILDAKFKQIIDLI